MTLCYAHNEIMSVASKEAVMGSRPEVPRSRHKNESPIDFVHNSRLRQGKVKIMTGLEPNTGRQEQV